MGRSLTRTGRQWKMPAATVVIVAIVARVAFSTHCMCTGNTTAKVRKRGQRSPAAETRVTRSCGAVLLLSRSFSLRLSPFLPFLHRLLPSRRPPCPRCQCTIAYSSLATQLRAVPRTAAIVIRGISHVGITRAIQVLVSPFIARGETSLSVVRCPSQGHSSECHSRGTAVAATRYSRTSRCRCTR